MRPLSKEHARILDTLTADLTDDHPRRKFDNAPGAFMAAVIEKVGPERFSVAHYFEQGGDRVADPDLEFVRKGSDWFPAAITQIQGHTCAVHTNEDGEIVSYKPRAYASLRSFAGVLLTNIKHQQGIKVTARSRG